MFHKLGQREQSDDDLGWDVRRGDGEFDMLHQILLRYERARLAHKHDHIPLEGLHGIVRTTPSSRI